MRGSYADQASALPSGCVPSAYAGSQQDILPVQRFSICEVQSNAGNPMYLPFQRQSYKSQHPCESRLRQCSRLGASTNQAIPANTTGVEMSSLAHHHTAATIEPLSYLPHSSSGQPSQGAGFGPSAASHTYPCIPAHRHSAYQQHDYLSRQQESSQPHMTCEESWPWDELLDSPGSDSYHSASTTYDPPSVDSIPDSYDSSIGSDTAFLPSQLWSHTSSNAHQAASQAGSALQGAAPALPPLAPKGPFLSAAAFRQLGPVSELRRVPRPRFKLANQRPTATRRSLLNDFDKVEDFFDDGSLRLDAHCSYNLSSLIRAHVQPGYCRYQQKPRHQLREWGLCKEGDYQEELLAHPASSSSFSGQDWHDPNASTDVVLAMGGMSIRKAPQHSKQHGPRSKSLGTQSADSGNADSMFAWLSKLLPAL